MGNSTELISFFCEQLQPFSTVTAKRMFGGHGLFCTGLMFALVSDDQLYFKADTELAKQFEHLGLSKFSYSKKGKICHINYYQAPESCMDDPDEMCRWAKAAYKVAYEASR